MERREVMRIRVWEKESSPGNEDDASTEDAFGENCIAAMTHSYDTTSITIPDDRWGAV